jgi:3-oxoacyl-[acyl-carrier-protein] synthase-3
VARVTIASPPVVAGTRIAGMGHYRPRRVVTNRELAKTIDTNDEWIRSRVGIVERRYSAPDETVHSMGAAAGRAALDDAGLTAADIDTVITATCTLEAQIPHASTRIAAALGIHAPGSFDVNGACAGFCYGLGVAAQAVRTGNAGNVLLVGSEQLTKWVDPADRANAIIFADGAGAAVVTASDVERIGPIAWGCDERNSEAIAIPDRRAFVFQEGQTVFRWATTAIAPVAVRAAERAGIDLARVDIIACHQANLRIVDAIANRIIAAVARTDVRIVRDIVTTGNTSSASIPIGLDRMRADGEAFSGDIVLAIGFGAGLTYAGQVFVCP